MQETAVYTQDSWELGHCTIVYNPINIPVVLMEESLCTDEGQPLAFQNWHSEGLWC